MWHRAVLLANIKSVKGTAASILRVEVRSVMLQLGWENCVEDGHCQAFSDLLQQSGQGESVLFVRRCMRAWFRFIMTSFAIVCFQSADHASTRIGLWSGAGWAAPGAGRLGTEFQTYLPGGQWRSSRHSSLFWKVSVLYIIGTGQLVSHISCHGNVCIGVVGEWDVCTR